MTAFIPWVDTPRAEMLCLQDERVIAKDNTVPSPPPAGADPAELHRFHDVTVTVRVRENPDRTLAVFHGPRCLARHDADGRLIETGRAHLARNGPTHTDRTSRRSSILDQRCAT